MDELESVSHDLSATVVLGKDVLLTNFALLVETAAQKTARIAKYAAANAAIVFAICQSAMKLFQS